MTTPQDLDERFRAALSGLTPASVKRDPEEPVRDGTALTGAQASQLFDAQLTSRHLDLAARWLRSFDEGYYTIGSAGHEGNAAVAAALRPNDPALLHYRSGAFYCARAAEVPDGDAIRDVLRGLVASARDPIAGGRHKVFGNVDLGVIPVTSTIASHLPRAVGLAYAIERGHRADASAPADVPAGAAPADAPGAAASGAVPGAVALAPDALVVCSFGDASVNHATATAAFNTAGWCDHSGLRLPLLFVCEDNGLGISVRSPDGWVAATLQSRPGLRYYAADGCDLAATYDAAVSAAEWVRQRRRPAVLHLSTVRLMGHAGADAELAYRAPAEIADGLARDPLVASARLLLDAGLATSAELLARYDEIGWEVRRLAEEVLAEPKLAGAGEVISVLAPRRPVRVARAVAAAAGPRAVAAAAPRTAGAAADDSEANGEADDDGEANGEARRAAFGGRLPERAGRMTLAQAINAALTDALVGYPQAIVFGEDVAVKGGVYGVTKGLRDRFGAGRVFDTLLDETSILGLALGSGLGGLLPIPEIQYLAYLHNAEDQLRGEAATMQFFSSGAYRNPMVVRVAGLAYQRGFGGHFHNDNAVAVLRDIPGLVVAAPARAEDAAAMLRTCLAAATTDGTVSVFLEPIALYHTRDLYADGDGKWLAEYAPPERWSEVHVPIGRARVYPQGSDDQLTIITYGNGVRMSLRVADRLAAEGIGARVLDMRWLAPLPVADIIREAAATGRVLVVDEARRSGGVAEGVLALLVDAGYVGVARRVAAVDSFVPLGPAAASVLLSEDQILQGARSLLPQ